MKLTSIRTPAAKRIALVAHDNMKPRLLGWVSRHQGEIERHTLFATGTTGSLLAQKLGLKVEQLLSGPLGGDQQIGTMIAKAEIDLLVFFWDPLEAQPHDPDVKALLRLAAVWNIPVACNEASADMFVHSALFNEAFERMAPDYEVYSQTRSEI